MKITKTPDGKIIIDGESNVLVINPPNSHLIIAENLEPGEDIYIRNFIIMCKNKRYNLRNKLKLDNGDNIISERGYRNL
ncbi:MAG: hypothetical protein GYA51_02230 [Candidatus Methanofastidiosa archaeon]|nr:hypothetical protein [Candidatus Methanofastidiosa archaeon]